MEEMAIERKSSLFWVSFVDHRGRTVCSQKKAWLEDFMVDPDTGKGKCDLDFNYKIDEAPTTELRDWLLNDCFVTLHTSYPKTENKSAGPDTAEMVKDVVMAADGLPEVVTREIGVMRLEVSRLILKADPTPEDLDYHKMNTFFATTMLRKPEFVFKNHLISLKNTEVEMLEIDLA